MIPVILGIIIGFIIGVYTKIDIPNSYLPYFFLASVFIAFIIGLMLNTSLVRSTRGKVLIQGQGKLVRVSNPSDLIQIAIRRSLGGRSE